MPGSRPGRNATLEPRDATAQFYEQIKIDQLRLLALGREYDTKRDENSRLENS
jgi:hypothetical protein